MLHHGTARHGTARHGTERRSKRSVVGEVCATHGFHDASGAQNPRGNLAEETVGRGSGRIGEGEPADVVNASLIVRLRVEQKGVDLPRWVFA